MSISLAISMVSKPCAEIGKLVVCPSTHQVRSALGAAGKSTTNMSSHAW
jgi:hypothetical protein